MQTIILWFIIVLRIEFLIAVNTGRYELITDPKLSYEAAVTECERKGKEILTLHTGEDYDEFLSWLPLNHASGQEKDIWVGLKQITSGVQDYAWVDDNSPLEKGLCWIDHQPSEVDEIQCAYLDYSEGKLSTEICTRTRKIACYDPVSDIYTVFNTDATFYSAAEECSQHGQYLPILKTREQMERLKAEQDSIGESVWVGLIEVEKNKYQWINGDGLSRYKWENGDKGLLVHGHRHINTYFELHAPDGEVDNKRSRPYVCQKKKTNATFDNYYKLEAENVVMFLSPLNVFSILKRTDCAMECSKDPTCWQYTLDGSVCKTYGKGLYWSSHLYGDGVNLFKRRIVSSYL